MRIHDVHHFRAYGVRLPWDQIVADRLKRSPNQHVVDEKIEPRLDLRLAWACSPELGVPREPFVVWQRAAKWVPEPVPFGHRPALGGGTFVWWGGQAAGRVTVVCTALAPGAPIGLFGVRDGQTLEAAVAATRVQPDANGNAAPTVAAASMTGVVLVNAVPTDVRIVPVQAIIDDGDWKPYEIVGLPVTDRPLDGYSGDEQGLVSALVTADEAALQRIKRGAPQLGWWPATQTGRAAPPWKAPDPKDLLAEIHGELYDHVEPIWRGGRPEREQQTLRRQHIVAAPHRIDGAPEATQPTTADVRPLALLAIPAGTDPFLNLALGFGTAYDQRKDDRAAIFDWLVTAAYQDCVLGTKVEVASYVPRAETHGMLPYADAAVAERAALVPPASQDGPWRESIRVTWLPRTSLAVLQSGSLVGFAGYDPAVMDPTTDLVPERRSGGPQPLTVARPAPTATPGSERAAVVHPDLELPISGSVTRGHCVAIGDVFGVWSPWIDRETTGAAPDPEGPRLVSVALTATYGGSSVCVGELALELAQRWVERSVTAIDVTAVLWPMATGKTPPPAGLTPGGVVPAGCHAVTARIDFAGREPSTTTAGAAVLGLDDNGQPIVGPVAAKQSEAGRRYRLTVPTPGLDFSGVTRWGVQVWARARLAIHPAPTDWAPGPGSPAIAVCASPVPIMPVPPPLPPGVPLGSTPDAQGLSHVRVTWTPFPKPPADRVVVWETSETVLLERLGGPGAKPDRTAIPGVRLQRLWDVYDAAAADARKPVFTRVGEFDPGAGAADITLPKGSQDVHLLVVTTVTTTGLESPWPDAGGGLDAHEHLQAAMAPRLRTPAQPVVRVDASGASTRASLESASPIPVTGFELYATRSTEAARTHLTMGLPVATVAAADAGRTDVVSRAPVYAASWTAALTGAWEPWLVRAVAMPALTVDTQAERGVPSPASEVVSLLVPPSGAPGLAPLTVTLVGGDPTRVLVQTATSLPARANPIGHHRVSAVVGAVTVEPVDLDAVAEGSASAPPASAAPPVLRRGIRAGGQTPLLLWAARPDPTQALPVSVTVTDALGRASTVTATVPAQVVAPPVGVTLSWVGITVRLPKGSIIGLSAVAPMTAAAGWRIEATVSDGLSTLTGSQALSRLRLQTGSGIKLSRGLVFTRGPLGRAGRPTPIFVWAPMLGVREVQAQLVGPGGAVVPVRWHL